MKLLTLIRHAKAVEATTFEDDHERALRGRGRPRPAAAELGQQRRSDAARSDPVLDRGPHPADRRLRNRFLAAFTADSL
ncbi:MAG: hypothetical protein WDN69_17570 [Aliidongia sp.]